MNRSDDIQHLCKALSSLQNEITDADKDTAGYGYKYADLAQVLSLIRPLLQKNGLSFTQPVSNADGIVVIETLVMHESGQWMSSELRMPPTAGSKMSAAQAIGSAITYGRRYALTAIFGIAQQDDDAADHRQAQPNKSKSPEPVPAEPEQAAKQNPEYWAAIKKALEDMRFFMKESDALSVLDIWEAQSRTTKKYIWEKLNGDEKSYVQSLKPQ